MKNEKVICDCKNNEQRKCDRQPAQTDDGRLKKRNKNDERETASCKDARNHCNAKDESALGLLHQPLSSSFSKIITRYASAYFIPFSFPSSSPHFLIQSSTLCVSFWLMCFLSASILISMVSLMSTHVSGFSLPWMYSRLTLCGSYPAANKSGKMSRVPADGKTAYVAASAAAR